MLKFINDVIKPWDELNTLLAQRNAFQPDLSDVTRLASTLAVSISHYPESKGLLLRDIDLASLDNKLIRDIADAFKHGNLRDLSRQNDLYVAALFECNQENKFRFLRNAIYVRHNSQGERDFMRTALGAIRDYISNLERDIVWNGQIEEGSNEYHPTVFLYFNPKYCIHMKQTRLQFFRRNEHNDLEPYDPPQVEFEVFDIPDKPR